MYFFYIFGSDKLSIPSFSIFNFFRWLPISSYVSQIIKKLYSSSNNSFHFRHTHTHINTHTHARTHTHTHIYIYIFWTWFNLYAQSHPSSPFNLPISLFSIYLFLRNSIIIFKIRHLKTLLLIDTRKDCVSSTRIAFL